jgi:hypothetical protein
MLIEVTLGVFVAPATVLFAEGNAHVPACVNYLAVVAIIESVVEAFEAEDNVDCSMGEIHDDGGGENAGMEKRLLRK